MTFDEIIKQAFSETIDERLEQMCTVTPKPKFSLSYRLWKHKLLRNLRRGRHKKHWTLRKARYTVIAMAAVFSVLIGGTAFAAAIMFGRYGFVDKIDYSKVLIENYSSDKTTFEEYYGLPEEDGWGLLNNYTSEIWSISEYRRGDIKVSFMQQIIHDGTMGNISTDRAKAELLSLYEENDGFALEFDNATLIYWIYDGYLFEISGNITKNDAINLALSTEIIDFSEKIK